VAGHALLFEEFCTTRKLQLNLAPLKKRVLVHSHCHQKAFNTVGGLASTLNMIPGLEVEFVDSGCCGMAGVFGYGADTYDISMQMGELSLFPTVRREPETTIIVADGSSCRHQIEHGTSRRACHTARVLQHALAQEPDR
jgi:Fe-S oxidoreductase